MTTQVSHESISDLARVLAGPVVSLERLRAIMIDASADPELRRCAAEIVDLRQCVANIVGPPFEEIAKEARRVVAEAQKMSAAPLGPDDLDLVLVCGPRAFVSDTHRDAFRDAVRVVLASVLDMSEVSR